MKWVGEEGKIVIIHVWRRITKLLQGLVLKTFAPFSNLGQMSMISGIHGYWSSVCLRCIFVSSALTFCIRSQCFLFAHDSKHSPQNDILVQLEKQIVALGGTPPFMDR
jgi:hypothetical protein